MLTDETIARYLDSPVVRSLVSTNTAYYLRQWRAIAKKARYSERIISITLAPNWMAILFFTPWAMYRRLYGLVVISSAVWLMLLVLEVVTGRSFLIGWVLFTAFLGSMGNSFYLIRTLRDVADIDTAAEPSRREAELLQRRAPRPLLAVVGVAIVSMQAVVGGTVLGWFER